MYKNQKPKTFASMKLLIRVVRTLNTGNWVAEILSYWLDIVVVVGVALRPCAWFKIAPTIE
jgi:hypothetical protein